MKETSPKSACKLTNCRDKKEKSKPLNLAVDWFQEEVKNFNMVEPKTHSNPWHLNPHKTITNNTEYKSLISTPIPFLNINLTKQLVLKNHSHHHQATIGFSSKKKASDSEREPFFLPLAKSSSPSESWAGSQTCPWWKEPCWEKVYKPYQKLATQMQEPTTCSWKIERQKKNDFLKGKEEWFLRCRVGLPQTATFYEGMRVCKGRRGGVMLGRVKLG